MRPGARDDWMPSWSAETSSWRCSGRRSPARSAPSGCHLFTVLGPAGDRQVAARPRAGGGARRRGDGTRRPLPVRTGKGITFWPLRELVLRSATARGRRGGGRSGDEAAAARRHARRAGGDRLGGADGCSSRIARERPLVLVFEDIHWAERDVPRPGRLPRRADAGRADPPLCLARPELLDGSRPGAAADERHPIMLEPLSMSSMPSS